MGIFFRTCGTSLRTRYFAERDDQEVEVHRVLHSIEESHRVLRSSEETHRALRSSEETHRVLRSITTAHLEPLHKLQGWDFIDGWFQCAEAHYLAWTHGIHHQDPSLNNLMYRGRRDSPLRRDDPLRPDGQSEACPVLGVCAVLNDWDLALDASVLATDASVLATDASVSQTHTSLETHTGLQRAGTMQFMAIARLESEAWGGYHVHEADGHHVHGVAGHLQHLYRHDLEAFFYILAWVLCCYKDGRRLDPLPPFFETWIMSDETWTMGDGMWTMGDARAWTMGNARACLDSNARACSDSNARAWSNSNARACLDSKYRFIHDELWPHDSLPTDSWSSAMKVFAHSIRFFFAVMLRTLAESAESRAGSAESQAGSAESQAGSPESWMQSRLDSFMAQIEGRALPPPPQEDDRPTEIWEDFCDAVKEGLLTLSTDNRTNLKKEDLPPRLASFLPDSQMDTAL